MHGIVHFGEYVPAIPEDVIEELRKTLGTTELHTISEEFSPGDAVQIADGTLRGLSAVVTRVMPGRERIAVLMELLGQQTPVELPIASIIKESSERAIISMR